ncbi:MULTISPECIES: hypothetical protein [unclassified Thermosynechococcus]|uniref:hypothetical protein n=2 Tax=Thermosynechococcus TaxID=146785 RepID=UPI0028F43E62|nr:MULTISPECIES: hypothetical protein [unclassified Thermosynechococcus]
MAQIRVFYEPETELLSVFWQVPRRNQVATELGDGVILFKDGVTGEPIGLEILSYRPGDDRFDAVSVVSILDRPEGRSQLL